MSKLDELLGIIYDYDDLLSYWLGGTRAFLYETDEGKTASEVADNLRNRAVEIIGQLKSEEELNKAIESWH